MASFPHTIVSASSGDLPPSKGTFAFFECSVKNGRGEVSNVQKYQISEQFVKSHSETLREICTSIKKLSSEGNCSSIVSYEGVWLEGPECELCNKLLTEQESSIDLCLLDNNTKQSSRFHGKLPSTSAELSSTLASPEVEMTVLCIAQEVYNYVTLEEWLRDREHQYLYETQISHIVSQVYAALTLLSERGIGIVNGGSFSDIHVLEERHSAHDLLPVIKVANFDFEVALTSLFEETLHAPSKSCLEPGFITSTVAQLVSHLLQRNVVLDSDDSVLHDDKQKLKMLAAYPDECAMIEKAKETSSANLSWLSDQLEKLREKYRCGSGLLLNVTEPRKIFVGSESQLATLYQLVTSAGKSSVVMIEGPSGSGKSELVAQLIRKVTQSREYMEGAFICLNAKSRDSLMTSVHGVASHSKLKVATHNHLGNARALQDIFRDILVSCAERNLMLVFDNVNGSSEEMLDLLQSFKDSVSQSFEQSCKHHLVIVTGKPWKINPALVEHATVSLSQMSETDAIYLLSDALKRFGIPGGSEVEDMQKMVKVFERAPPSVYLIAAFLKHGNSVSSDSVEATNSLKCLLQTITTFTEKFPEILNVTPDLRPICLAYALSLYHLYESYNKRERQLATLAFDVLVHVDGEMGMSTETLFEVLKLMPVPELTPPEVEHHAQNMIMQLRKLSLVTIKDSTVLLPSWMQRSLQQTVTILSKSCIQPGANSRDILSALRTMVSSISSEDDYWKVVPHGSKLWVNLCTANPGLVKEFDSIPETIGSLANRFHKFEGVVGFLKEAADILASAFQNPYDFHVLKLKFALAQDCLLPSCRTNEAFAVFKMIQEQSRTEPRESLMLKLKALVELGQINISRQDYDKAISCFQQVQIFAVQKISLLELDSEPTVLKSRMLHGYAHLLQNNPTEAKKILLHLIPLLDRYCGPEMGQVGKCTLQAKFYLAKLLRQTGDLVNALMMQTKVLERREVTLGPRHPDTWDSKQEMALLFSAYDNHDKALVLLREVLEVQEEILGAPSNRQSLTTMNAIAEIESKLGNFDDALELYEAIDLIQQQVLLDNDQMKISSQLNQAEVLIALGQYKEATDILDLVYALISSNANSSSQQVVAFLENINNKREQAARSMEVLGTYWLSLSPDIVDDDPSDLGILAKKHEVAIELLENQDNHGALRFLREVLEDCGHLDETNRFHLNVKADLARVLGLVGKFNESFCVYKEIIPLMDATFGETDELTMLCKDTMGQVFLFSGNQFLKKQMSNLKWFLF